MSRVYDNWEKLVGAVIKREELKRLALCESFSTISADSSFRLSFSSSFDDVSAALQASGITGKTFDTTAHSSHRVQPIKLKEINKATKKFQLNMLLGQGGFGPVYKGWINEHTLAASKHGSGMAVAVKKWAQGSSIGHQVWQNEINYLSQLHHPNLVKLIGYCSEEGSLILVYEFMPKGSLDNHLFRSGHQSLSWRIRLKVAIGVARALSFLHDFPKPIIHRFIQCSSILLDGEFNAKLSSFGWARGGPTGDMSHVSTRVLGPHNAIAPEYAMTGHLTEKCDVYSFGIVLLALLFGHRATDSMPSTEELDFMVVEWAKQRLSDERKMLRDMDSGLEGQYPLDGAYAVLKLACQCLSTVPEERPRMDEVVIALERL